MKEKGKLSFHFTADQDTVDTIYRIILSVNQLSVYRAVAAFCEEFEDHQDRTGQPVILVGLSIVLGEVKAETPVHDEDPRNDQIILQQYIQQIESLSPKNRVSKFCKEAGFMRVVEVGQYFVTKDTGDFRQFHSVACCAYTLPRDDRASQPKGWIQGNMRIGPVLEVTTSFQHFKYGIEIRIESVNQDDSHSWVRISYGTVKYVIGSIEDNTENPADPQEEQIPQTSTSVVAVRSKAKAKPQPRVLAGYVKEDGLTLSHQSKISSRTISSRKSSIFFDLIRRSIEKKMEQLNSARKSFVFEILIHKYKIGPMIDGKLVWLQAEDPNEDISIALIILGTIIYLRALQGHSGSNLIDPTIQDNVLIGTGIFPYIYNVGCTFNLHSIFNNGLVPGGQNLNRRQTVFFLPVDPRDESHKDPEYIDFSVPRLARYMHSAWKRHQDAVFWVDIDLAIREGLTLYQTRSNAIILQGTLPAHCILRAERLKIGEKLFEEQYLSPRPPPKISFKHDLNWTKGNDQGSTVEHQPVGKLVQQSLGEALQSGSSKPTQFPKTIKDRTGKLVTQEIVGKSQGELSSSDRTGQPVKDEEKRVLKNHDRTGEIVEGRLHKVQEDGYLKNRDDANKFNLAMDDENIDFNISGVSNAMVKRSKSINIHNLIQQIENHPLREALQSVLQQHRAFNPFSEELKDAIMAVR